MGFCPVWPSWMPPDVPAPARMPVAPSTLVNSIVPSLTTLLLLSSVTAGPATVGLIDPAEVILISSGAPDLIVEVRTGAVVAVAIVVSAWAAVERRVARQVEASKVSIGRAHVELQSLMRISYAGFSLTKKTKNMRTHTHDNHS